MKSYVAQPTLFFRRTALEEVGFVDENLHMVMDFELLLRLYINGERQTDFSTETYPSQNTSFAPIVSGEFQLGKYSATDRACYLAHVHYCDGYAYNADSFGSTDATTGEWKINTAPTPTPRAAEGRIAYVGMPSGMVARGLSPTLASYSM